MGIGGGIGVVCRAAAEHLAPSKKLGMDLKADDGFIGHSDINIA